MRRVIFTVTVLVLAGCGGGAASATPAPGTSTPSPTASIPTAANPVETPPPLGTPPAATATPVTFTHGIVSVQTASGVAADGSASDPRVRFLASGDRKVVIVLALDSSVAVGTKLGFLRTLDGKYVDSKKASVVKAARYFYFEFAAAAGKSLTPGHYLVKLYVSGSSSGQVAYDVV